MQCVDLGGRRIIKKKKTQKNRGRGRARRRCCCFFFFKQKTAYEIGVRLVGSEMCIRDRAARARSAKAARSVFGPEVTESLEALQLVQRANLTVGVGRKNPNAMSNGRERRGKPRKK